MSDSFDAQGVYCPECNGDYTLAWSKDRETMYVVCDCGEAEAVDDFLDRFRDEYTDTTDDRMFQ